MVLAALAGGFGLAWRFRSRLAGGRGRCGCGRAAPGECPARRGSRPHVARESEPEIR